MMIWFYSSRFRLSRPLPLVVCVTAWLFIIIIQPAIPAYGHALPSTFSIDPNAILEKDSIPSQLVISFTERPDPKISYIHVVNSQNERIDNDNFTITGLNGRQATVTLDNTKLEEDGVYTVSWRTMSLDDGHIAQGSYVFGVGNVTPDNVGNQQTQPQAVTYVTSTVDALLKWPMIISQAAIVGGIIAYFVLQGRGLHNLSRNDNQFSFYLKLSAKRFALILVAGAISIAVCGTALVFLQASNLNAGSNEQYLSTVQSLIFNTPTGTVWILRIATSVIIAVLAFVYFVLTRKAKSQGKSSSTILLAILVAGAASIFSNSMLSHNSAVTFLPSVAVFADWLHFMAVSAWVGGLFYFSAVLLFTVMREKSSRRAYYLSLILPRFSLLATASLGIIGVAGIYMAWIQLHTLDSLFYSQYGNYLIIKLSAALPMVLLGAYHQVKVHKSIVLMASMGSKKGSTLPSEIINNAAPDNDVVSRFGKTIKIESLIGIGVLFAASLLTITSPPHQMQQQQQQAGAMPEIGMENSVSAFLEEATISGVDATFEITPFHAGFNTFTLMLRDAAGSSPQNINAVFLRFTNPEARIGPIAATLDKTDDDSGNYSAIGGYLSQPGNWTIDLIVQRIGAYDLNHRFEATIEASPAHGNMDMHAEMNMQMQDNASSVRTTTTTNNAQEDQSESPPPAFDSFAWLAIGLSAAVGVGSAYYYKRSKLQLENTLRMLKE
jgi:copper transport protein